jgi:hypothetical protein
MGALLMYANGVNLATLGYNVSTRAGRLQTAARRGKNHEVAARHGGIHTPGKKFTGATVVLPMWCVAADEDGNVPRDGTMRDLVQAHLDRLLGIFGADQVELVSPMADGSRRRITGQVLDAIAPTVQAGGTRIEFAVSLVCASAFWEDVDQVSSSRSGTGLWEVLPFQGANAPMDDLLVRFTAPCTNPRLTNPRGVYVAYNAALTSSQWVEINCSTWAVAGGSGLTANLANVDHAGDARWFVLEPGDPTPRVTASQTAGSTGGFALTGRRKYKTG